MARTKFSELRKEVEAGPGARERLAAKRAETLEEIRLYELRHAEAVSQAELAGRLDVTQGAISKLEHSDDVRVSTLRQYLEALGARLELVAVSKTSSAESPSTSARTTPRSRPLAAPRCTNHVPDHRETAGNTGELRGLDRTL
jgi:transcriptional regulator with XRE-family HTH domain